MKNILNLNVQTRNGDWICQMCSNYNFAFRKDCNRCQTQTKFQNDFQILMNQYHREQNNSKSDYLLEQIQLCRQISEEETKGFQNMVLISPRKTQEMRSRMIERGYQSPIVGSISPLSKHMKHFY